MRNVANLILGLALTFGALTACTDETVFTDEERATLEEYRLPTETPRDATNKYVADAKAIILGKAFFFDPRFSGPLNAPNDGVTNGSLGPAGTVGKVSCFTCHDPLLGGADRRSRPMTVSLGASYASRNAPTIINVAYSPWMFWDGRRDSVWAQVIPVAEAAGVHNGTRLQFAHIIYDKYKTKYEEVFGAEYGPLPDLSDTVRFPATGKPGQPSYDMMAPEDKVTITRIYVNFAKAIAAYEAQLVSLNYEKAPFDKMLDEELLENGDLPMSPAAIRGARLFIGKAACNECHRTSNFSDGQFHNIGCPQGGGNVPAVDVGRNGGIAGVKADVFNRTGEFSDKRDGWTHLDTLPTPDDNEALEDAKGRFKTPNLRNISLTAPYMHDGVYTNLWDVVNHYNFGGGTGVYSGVKEVTIAPLLLDDREIDDIVEFLRSLQDGAPKPHVAFPEGLGAPPMLPM